MADEIEKPSYTTIVLPTDGSAASRLATSHAIYLAALTGARLVPVYIVDETAARRAGVNVQRAMDDMRKKGRDVLDATKELAEREGVAVEPMLIEGQTAPAILKLAVDQQADLIIVGATAYSDIGRLLARAISISEEILKRAHCPVLVVRAPSADR